MEECKLAASVESNCQRLGDLAALAVPAETRAPSTEEWAAIERKLNTNRGRRSFRRWWPAFAFSAVAILFVAGWFVFGKPLGYRLESCTLAPDGSLSGGTSGQGAIAFDDGTQITLDEKTRIRVKALRWKKGANIHLDDGEAKLAVVHREGRSWTVLAGPFRVDVTGTRFGASWSQQHGRFHITMLEGEVRVSGGPIATATSLRAGQTLEANVGRYSIESTKNQSPPPARERKQPDVVLHSTAGKTVHVPETTRPLLAQSATRRRLASSTAGDERTASATSAETEPSTIHERLLGEPMPSAIGEEDAIASQSEPPPQAKPAIRHVVFGKNGKFSNGFTGMVKVMGGNGTTFSTPTSWDAREHLQPDDGLLCTSGTVAGLSCINEGTPRYQCDWGVNWGVSIEWDTREDKKAWGDEASSAIAVEFRGRSAKYRLNAHLKGDPSSQFYCIEDYKSDQVVKPSMFKSECRSGTGATLTDFKGVDSFNLQFTSSTSYVAFRYCISDITLYP
jgi:hypothetical protein